MSRQAKRNKTEIFSVFGQCEAVAAEMMIKKHGLYRIPANEIPESVAVNNAGVPAQFAVVVPARLVPAFNKLCAELRA